MNTNDETTQEDATDKSTVSGRVQRLVSSDSLVKLSTGMTMDVSPMTAEQWRLAAIKMLQDHIRWGEQVFPFILNHKKSI